MNQNLSAALDYLRRGMSVIPLEPKGKRPLIKWQEFQTRRPTEAEVEAWFTRHPDANVGLVTGSISGVIAVDADGPQGIQWVKDHMPKTGVYQRTGKGWHAFYRQNGTKVPNTVRLVPEVDVRGDGGYVVIAPSIHPSGRQYELEIMEGGWDNLTNYAVPKSVPPVPPIENGTVGQNEETKSGQGLTAENRGTSLGQAVGQRDNIPQGQRDDTLTRMVGHWFHKGLERDEVLTLARIANQERCKPPLPDADVLRIVDSIGKRDQANAPAPLVCLSIGDILSMEFPERGYVLHPAIPSQGLAMLYAPRGMGKTFAGLSLAYAVATGSSIWSFKAPEPKRVLYLDGEMPAGTIQERLAALVTGSDVQPNPDFLRIITPDVQANAMPNLASEAGQRAVAPYVQDADLIVIDNLATLARNGRENESESWLPVQRWLLELRRQGKSVLIVHHAGKGGNQRGTSAKEDVLDVVIALRRPGDYSPEEGARFEVHFEKARGVCGDAVKPFEAALVDTGRGLQWTVRELDNVERDRVLALHKEGMTVREIAEETKISKSKVHRIIKEVER